MLAKNQVNIAYNIAYILNIAYGEKYKNRDKLFKYWFNRDKSNQCLRWDDKQFYFYDIGKIIAFLGPEICKALPGQDFI